MTNMISYQGLVRTFPSAGDVIKFVTRLKRKVTEETADKNEIDIEKYNNISHVLLYIHREFRDELPIIVKLFSDSQLKNELSEVLLSAISGDFKEENKDVLKIQITTLIKKIDSTS